MCKSARPAYVEELLSDFFLRIFPSSTSVSITSQKTLNIMYSPLQDKSERSSESAEDHERLLEGESDASFRKAPRRTPIWISIVLLPLASVCLVGFGVWIGLNWHPNVNAMCLDHVQKYSPILKEVDNSYHIVHFNGSLFKENEFRQPAGPEVDAAWESLGVNYRSIAVPVSEAARSGIKPDQVQINPKHGGGFPANVEGLHHLHCLNLLRQSLYFNIDYYRSQGKGAFVNEDMIVRHHVSHCLDIIRQQLMCTPDTGLLGQVWWDPKLPKAFVDFNTEHKCKNFDAIRQWAQERQIPELVANDFLKPPKHGDTIYEEIP